MILIFPETKVSQNNFTQPHEIKNITLPNGPSFNESF
jgi:hypothetical protein